MQTVLNFILLFGQALGFLEGVFNVDSIDAKANHDTLTLLKIEQLEKKVGDLEKYLNDLRDDNKKKEHKIKYLVEITKTLAPKNCVDLAKYGVSSSDTYLIDPDGPKKGSNPFEAYCDFDSGSVQACTLVGHDKENMPVDILHCNEPGCFKVDYQYEADISALTELIAQSDRCEQSITFQCLMAPLAFGSSSFLASWTDKNGRGHKFWHGNDTNSFMCQCGYDNSCRSRFGVTENKCNCNGMLSEWTEDSGLITDSRMLPITSFSYGPLQDEKDQGKITVGPLKCYGSKSRNLHYPYNY